MNKKLLISAVALIVSTSTFAGGILTNTNQNASYLRNPARDAVIAIDGVYSNPAGIAFLPEGFHFSLSWQAAWQKREITSTMPFYALNTANPGVMTKEFVGEATAPVIPSFQAAYVINDKWSVSAQFAIGGGGGKCEFENGLPMFEKLVYSNIATGVATNPLLPTGSSVAGYALNQNLTGEQYFYGLQVGGTYKVTDKVSVFGGVRGVLANCSYVGAISNISGNVRLPEVAGGVVMEGAATSDDFNLDCSQNGFGITPIVGVDVNLGNLNLAAKYEFRTKINLENESKNTPNVDALMPAYADKAEVRSDIPSLLTLGAQYSFSSVRIGAGFHCYWDKDAQGSPIKEGDNTWEALLGVEWDMNEKVTLSCGGYRTEYGFDDADMNDTNFNISSYGLCLGGAYKINDMLKVNVSYMHSFYDEHEVPMYSEVNGSTMQIGNDLYTRKNDVVGVSLDFKF